MCRHCVYSRSARHRPSPTEARRVADDRIRAERAAAPDREWRDYQVALDAAAMATVKVRAARDALLTGLRSRRALSRNYAEMRVLDAQIARIEAKGN